MKTKYEVNVSFKSVVYIEEANEIAFDREPGVNVPAVIYIPSIERWQRTAPEWARDKRDVIVSRLKEKLGVVDYVFEEF
ncbi:MAG: hypothetical protein GXY05_14630 [Clostridiales bacterium]|nr:hypothetical protein [Clostridiales bacterium]